MKHICYIRSRTIRFVVVRILKVLYLLRTFVISSDDNYCQLGYQKICLELPNAKLFLVEHQ